MSEHQELRPSLFGSGSAPLTRVDMPIFELIRLWQSEKPGLQTPKPLDQVMERGAFRALDSNGLYTPQGWALSIVTSSKDWLKELDQAQADLLFSRVFGLPLASTIAFRHLTNLRYQDTSDEQGVDLRRQLFVKALTTPSSVYGQATQGLEILAKGMDKLSKEEWNLVEGGYIRHENEGKINRTIAATGSFADFISPQADALTQIVKNSYEKAAELDVAQSQGFTPSEMGEEISFERATTAAGRAAVEIMHKDELVRRDYEMTYLPLFSDRLAHPLMKQMPVLPDQINEVTITLPAVLTNERLPRKYVHGNVLRRAAGVGLVSLATLTGVQTTELFIAPTITGDLTWQNLNSEYFRTQAEINQLNDQLNSVTDADTRASVERSIKDDQIQADGLIFERDVYERSHDQGADWKKVLGTIGTTISGLSGLVLTFGGRRRRLH